MTPDTSQEAAVSEQKEYEALRERLFEARNADKGARLSNGDLVLLCSELAHMESRLSHAEREFKRLTRQP